MVVSKLSSCWYMCLLKSTYNKKNEELLSSANQIFYIRQIGWSLFFFFFNVTDILRSLRLSGLSSACICKVYIYIYRSIHICINKRVESLYSCNQFCIYAFVEYVCFSVSYGEN